MQKIGCGPVMLGRGAFFRAIIAADTKIDHTIQLVRLEAACVRALVSLA